MKVYIDGENFRKGLTRVLIAERIIKNPRDMESFPMRALLKDVLATDKLSINYYASKIKLPNGYLPDKRVMEHVQKIKDYTRKWVPSLEKQDIRYVKAGYLKVKSSKECPKCGHKHDLLQEKGVDVRLAADMLEDAYNSQEKTLVIVSSDTDLCPAFHKVKAQGKRVIYVCLADSTNRAVSAVATETVTISTAKLKKYAELNNG